MRILVGHVPIWIKVVSMETNPCWSKVRERTHTGHNSMIGRMIRCLVGRIVGIPMRRIVCAVVPVHGLQDLSNRIDRQ